MSVDLAGRDIFENGVVMVGVTGNSISSIPTNTNLGIADTPVRMEFEFNHDPITTDAGGRFVPMDVQGFLGTAIVSFNLIHFDKTVMREVMRLSQGAPAQDGTLTRAGKRLGGNNARFAPGWNYVSLNLSSPIGLLPWRFLNAYLTGRPVQWPLGTERSLLQVNFRVIPYTTDPWNNGAGAEGLVLYDHGTDA